MSTIITQFQKVNSTSYVDVLGLQLGLDRLQGETSDEYTKRLEFAARLRRAHPYEGTLNEVSLQLGFEPTAYMRISSSQQEPSIINISIAGIQIDANPIVPLLTFDKDTMWKFRMLSDVVSDINSLPFMSAELLVTDGPAFQLARQSNSLWAFAESVSGLKYKTQFAGIKRGSEVFNQSVPAYTITDTGILVFPVEPDSGTEITYNYITFPYEVVGSPVALIGLTDPEFPEVAETTDGILAYQVREFLQAIMLIDRSYWAK